MFPVERLSSIVSLIVSTDGCCLKVTKTLRGSWACPKSHDGKYKNIFIWWTNSRFQGYYKLIDPLVGIRWNREKKGVKEIGRERREGDRRKRILKQWAISLLCSVFN